LAFYSQFHEDRDYLVPIFDAIGARTHTCFEVGAWDGIKFSNTRHFIERHWRGCLIESDPDKYQQLLSNNTTTDTACFNKTISETSGLDAILFQADMPKDMDLGSIDIDGQDYWAWKDMDIYRPRVMVVEYNPAEKRRFIPPRGQPGQAGLEIMSELAEIKGYEVLHTTQVNLICVRL
jgi:hypothetical protein